jgi:hypothetical protein
MEDWFTVAGPGVDSPEMCFGRRATAGLEFGTQRLRCRVSSLRACAVKSEIAPSVDSGQPEGCVPVLDADGRMFVRRVPADACPRCGARTRGKSVGTQRSRCRASILQTRALKPCIALPANGGQPEGRVPIRQADGCPQASGARTHGRFAGTQRSRCLAHTLRGFALNPGIALPANAGQPEGCVPIRQADVFLQVIRTSTIHLFALNKYQLQHP